MSEQLSLKAAERRAVRLSTQDGLWEILLGLMILSLGVSGLLRDHWGLPWSYAPVVMIFVVGIPAQMAAKRAFSAPRIGSVKFGPQRRAKFKRVNAVLITLVALTWLLPLLAGSFNLPAGTLQLPFWFVDALFGVLISAFFIGLSLAFETPRMIVYGLFLGLSLPADVLVEHYWGLDLPLAMLLAGLVVLVGGVLSLLRFLKTYPPVMEPLNSHG